MVPLIVKRRDPIAWFTLEGLTLKFSRCTVMELVLMSNVALPFYKKPFTDCAPVANTTVLARPAGAKPITTVAHTSQLASLMTRWDGPTGFLVPRFQCICLLTAYRHISLNAISLNVPWYYIVTYDTQRPEPRIGNNPAPILSQTPETASRPPESGEPESPNPPDPAQY